MDIMSFSVLNHMKSLLQCFSNSARQLSHLLSSEILNSEEMPGFPRRGWGASRGQTVCVPLTSGGMAPRARQTATGSRTQKLARQRDACREPGGRRRPAASPGSAVPTPAVCAGGPGPGRRSWHLGRTQAPDEAAEARRSQRLKFVEGFELSRTGNQRSLRVACRDMRRSLALRLVNVHLCSASVSLTC